MTGRPYVVGLGFSFAKGMFGFRNLVSRFWRGYVVISSSGLGLRLFWISFNPFECYLFLPKSLFPLSFSAWVIQLNNRYFLSLTASFSTQFLSLAPKLALPLKPEVYKMFSMKDLLSGLAVEISNSWALLKIKRCKAWHWDALWLLLPLKQGSLECLKCNLQFYFLL